MSVVDLINDANAVEQHGNDDGRIQVVVHRRRAACLDVGHIDGGDFGRPELGERAQGFHQPFVAFLGGTERIVREIERAAVVGLKHEKADRHGRIGLFKQPVRAGGQLFERDEIAERFAHFLSVDRDHVVVHPVTGRIVAAGGGALGDLAFVVREHQVHAPAMDVEPFAEVARAHGRALHVPAGKAVAPRRRPAHDVFGRGLFPQREVEGVALVGLSVQLARVGHHVFEHAAGQAAVAVFAIVSLDVEIDRAVAHIGESLVENGLGHFDLLDDMARSVGLDARREHVERPHGIVVALGVILRHLHRFELFEPGLLGDFVLAFVGIVFEVSHVGDVAHVTHLVARGPEVAEQQVEGDGGAGVSEMGIAVDGRAADIKSHERRVQRLELFFLAGERIVYGKRRFHRHGI